MINVGPYTLRDDQERGYHRIRQSFATDPWTLCVAPTGTGKTVLACAIMDAAARKGMRVGFIVSGRQLIYQASRKLEECGVDHAVMMSGEHYWPKPITVVSKDTYESWVIGKGYKPLNPDLWIVDEADIAISPTWKRILDESRWVLALTGTPITGDGKPLPWYTAMVEVASYSELISKGALCPVRCFSPYRPDLSEVGTSGSDYHQGRLGAFMDRQELVGDILTHWQRLAPDRPFVVFPTSVKHSIHIAEQFAARGVRVDHIDASTDNRDASFEAIERGEAQGLSSVGVLGRGFDLPRLSCAILAAPTKRTRTYLQRVGRVLRPHSSKGDAILIDHAGAVYEHGWPTQDREWSLGGDEVSADQRERDEQKPKEREPYCCPECACMWEQGHTCPNCGFRHRKRGQPVTNAKGELREVKRSKVKRKQGDREKSWVRCLAIAANRGGTVKSAFAMFKQQTGGWPDGLTPMPEPHLRDVKVRELYPGFVRGKKT